MALLEVTGLVKFYGRRKVVDGVSFDVNAGEVVGLLGPNGAGKTTSFRMTTGQIVPNAGKVVFNGQDVTAMPMYRRARLGMGYLSQEQSIFRKLSVEKNLLAILEALPRSRTLGRRLRRWERWERTNSLLERFGLTHIRKNISARASGGEKRRLEIARCLACEPLLILLDEPFAAVDPKTTEDIRSNIRDLATSGIGILLTDHNVREVLKITDRSYLIKDGQVVTEPVRPSNSSMIRSPSMNISARHSRTTPLVVSRPRTQLNRQRHNPSPFRVSGCRNFWNKRNCAVGWNGSVTTTPCDAQEELIRAGKLALPVLVESLERREIDVRVRVFELLKHMVGGQIDFDPSAPDEQRRRQVARLREWLKGIVEAQAA